MAAVKTKIEDVKIGDVLSKDAMTQDYTVLFSAGVTLTEENIAKLKKFKITEVNIEKEESSIPVLPDVEENVITPQEVAILQDNIEEEFHEKLQSILEKHTYSSSSELAGLSETADVLIGNILREEKVVEKVYDIRERSADVYEHCISVCSLATIIALKLKLEENDVHDLGVACLLHELGLRYISLDFEDKEISEMEKMDAMEYKKHPVYAYSALQNENWLSNQTKQMILYHHERMDGTGYPLKATEMSVPCKILQICDEFDEMICGLGHKRRKVYEALGHLKVYADIKYDKQILTNFMELIAVYPVGSYIRTNEGETAVVLRQNREYPDRPVIRVIKDKSGNPVKNIIIKDLVKTKNVCIEDIE